VKMRGKHSNVVVVDGKAIKVFHPSFRYNFWKEVRYLTVLQGRGFVPKLYGFNPKKLEVVMEFVDGVTIGDLVDSDSLDLGVFERCLDICFYLDRMRIQKEEMNHPHRHVLIKGDRVVFIDFERSHESKNPNNVSQFIVYLCGVFDVKIDSDLIDLIRDYKRYYDFKRYGLLKRWLFSLLR